MHTQPTELFKHLWQDYLSVTPSATEVHQLLGKGDTLINDHLALRTFDIEKVNLGKLAEHFLALGYAAKGDYHFQQKKLVAKHFEHPDPTLPKVFISELLVGSFPQDIQAVIHTMVDQLDTRAAAQEDFLYSGASWSVTIAQYQRLLQVSEYAAWMAAWGYRANHFTVSVNHLKNYRDLAQVNEALKAAGFVLNTAGGEIKGGPDVCLAQSATMADHMPVEFSDGSLVIPSCFYEFAERFRLPSGEFYTGFVAASADKIFESTHAS